MVQRCLRLGVLVGGLLPFLLTATSDAGSRGTGNPRARPSAGRLAGKTPRPAWRRKFPGASRVSFVSAMEGRMVLHTGYPSEPGSAEWTWRFHGLDLTNGKERWRRTAPAAPSSAVDGGRLYFLTPTELLALDWASGRKLWGTAADGDLGHPLLAQNGRVIYRERGGAVVAVDATQGHQLWRLAPPREYTRIHPLAIALGRVYLQKTAAGGHSLAALSPASGATEQEVRLAGLEDLDYVVTSLLWSPEQRRFLLREVKTGAGIDFRSLRALRRDLTEAWKQEHLGRFALAEGVLVCEAWKNVHNDRQGLMALDADDGRVLWRSTEAGQQEQSVVGVLGNTVAIRRGDRKLRGLEPRTGREAWSLSLPFTHAQAAGNTLLVFSDGKAGQSARVTAFASP